MGGIHETKKQILTLTIVVLITTRALSIYASAEQNNGTLSGTLNMILGDPEKEKPCVVYYLHIGHGEHVRIYPSVPVPLSYNGREVTVTGSLVQLHFGRAVNATAIVPTDPTPPSPAVSGTRKITMILLKYSDSASFTPNDPAYYSTLLNPTTNSLNAFYREESYQLLAIQADVYGWYTLPKPRSYYVYGTLTTCGVYFDRLVNDGVALADPYVYLPQYDDVSFVMNDYLDCCAWGGSWTITADGQTKTYGTTWMPPWSQNIGTYAHEVGHSIGCPHTGWVYGQYDSIWDVESGGTGFNRVLRGSYYSVAASRTVDLYSSDPCHHIAYHKIKLGWLDTWYSEVSSGTATLTVNALAGIRISYMAIKVRIPGEDQTKRYFTVEARTKINYDQWLPGEGVIIHFVDEDRVCTSVGGTPEHAPAYPIDSTPSTSTLDDAQWSVGSTYINNTYGLSISVLSKTGNSYQVRITYGRFDFSLSNSGGITATQGSSGANTITVTLTNGTSQTVSLSSSGLPLGATASFNPTSGNPAFSSICNITASSSTPTGSYMITVTGTGGGLTRTTAFTLTVDLISQPRPLTEVDSLIIRAARNTVYVVLPDYGRGVQYPSHTPLPKGGSVLAALSTDIFASAYVLGAFSNSQYEVLDTMSAYISLNPVGKPLTSPSYPIFTIASRWVNTLVYYYDNTLQSLLYLTYDGTNHKILQRSTGGTVASITNAERDAGLFDYFTIQHFRDVDGRSVLMIWGVGWKGSYAGAVYLARYILPNINSYTQSWYVYRWDEASSGPSRNSIPGPGDTYTLIGSG